VIDEEPDAEEKPRELSHEELWALIDEWCERVDRHLGLRGEGEAREG
jgi:hypothetical protein